ncbi:uncharacterized protein LOC116202521 [Punica granatum]|uniref:Uncharacterized protein LOC116202521 n=1 Tax=Punica granatum TaxID=22663 RepID=A0A6P8D8S2_PUNGR|nr:uncharacterized protein LOC116202521 [Punica granatum]
MEVPPGALPKGFPSQLQVFGCMIGKWLLGAVRGRGISSLVRNHLLVHEIAEIQGLFAGEVGEVVEREEEIAGNVEEAAEEVEKVAEEVADQLPEGGKLRDEIAFVENVAKHTAMDAHLAQEVFDKVEEVEKKVESIVDQAANEAPPDQSRN